MCGILGSVNFSIGQDTLGLIAHRGPDDFGMETFPVNDHKVILGQTRLSIIDLSEAGHQPMISSCGKYALIFNGEIYNHLELRAQLPESIIYNGHSDTETILNYLIHFGKDALKELNGIFAIAFLDLQTNSLILARDPFGVKPLYYHKTSNRLIFSSEIRPIRKTVSGLRLDKNALAELLRLRYNPSPDTLFQQIRKLQPGHLFQLQLDTDNLDGIIENFGIQAVEKKHADKDELVEKYGKALDLAVQRQLLADVEVGILLSGGIDSALVAAIAKKHCNGKLKAFTIGFEGDYQEDEIEDAAYTASILGLDHYYRKITFSDFLSILRECTRIVEEPLGTTSVIPMYFLSQLASEQVKVVLTGQGADEPLGGYARYKLELLKNIIPSFLHPMVNPLTKLLNTRNEQLIRAGNALKIKDELKRFLATYELFSNNEIQALIGIEDHLSIQRIGYMKNLISTNNNINSVEKILSIDTRMNLSDDLLNYTDKITMNFALECRVPMLDLDLVRFIESLPTEMKLNRNQGKIIHRKFAETILPKEIIDRPKKGFQSPTRTWFRNEIGTLKQLLLSEKTLFQKVFNKDVVLKILDEHIAGYNKEKQIFLLLSIYYWLEENNTTLSN